MDPPSLFSLATARGITHPRVHVPPDRARSGARSGRCSCAGPPPSCRRSSRPRWSVRRMCARPQSVDGRPFIGEVAEVAAACSSAPGTARGASAPARPPRRSPPAPSSTAPRRLRSSTPLARSDCATCTCTAPHAIGLTDAVSRRGSPLGCLHNHPMQEPADARDQRWRHRLGPDERGARHADDAGPGALLRRARAPQERALHDHAQLLHPRRWSA